MFQCGTIYKEGKYSKYIIKGGELSSSGGELSCSGGELSCSGDELSSSGDELSCSGDELSSSGDELSASEYDFIFRTNKEDKNYNKVIEISKQEEEDLLVRQLLIQQNYNNFINQKKSEIFIFSKQEDEDTQYEYSDSEFSETESILESE